MLNYAWFPGKSNVFQMMGRIDSMSARLDDLEKSMLAMLENVEEWDLFL